MARYSFQEIANGCGIIAQPLDTNAWAIVMCDTKKWGFLPMPDDVIARYGRYYDPKTFRMDDVSTADLFEIVEMLKGSAVNERRGGKAMGNFS